MKLNSKDIRYLRSLAHNRKVIVSVGNDGITKGVVNELDLSLQKHELIKVKLTGDTRDSRKICLERLSAAVDAEVVQLIGKIGVLYRAAKTPEIKLPG